MPNKGPLAFANVTPVDVFAPGAGLLTAFQDGRDISFEYALPAFDADGGELSGLAKVTVGIAPATESGENPFVDTATFFDVAVAIIEFDVNEGQDPVNGSFPILAFGKKHFLAAFAEDDSVEDPIEPEP
jgi:hypothetical protein